jgi:hypothetical protein
VGGYNLHHFRHSTLKLTKVNTYGLVFEWKGTSPELKPVLLAAHQGADQCGQRFISLVDPMSLQMSCLLKPRPLTTGHTLHSRVISMVNFLKHAEFTGIGN